MQWGVRLFGDLVVDLNFQAVVSEIAEMTQSYSLPCGAGNRREVYLRVHMREEEDFIPHLFAESL